MKEPPYMISPKDLLYLDDLLSHILVLNKKCNHYLNIVQNEVAKKEVTKVKDLLCSQYDELINIMEE